MRDSGIAVAIDASGQEARCSSKLVCCCCCRRYQRQPRRSSRAASTSSSRTAQGSVVPGATVDVSGPAAQSQVTDDRGEAHFLNLPPGTYTVNATLQGFRPYTERSGDRGVRQRHSAPHHDAGERGRRIGASGRLRAHRRPGATDRDDEHLIRRTAADPVVARPVGRAADRPRHHRRSRQRRRRRVGSAVELPRQGRCRYRTTRGTSTASRSPISRPRAVRPPTTPSTCSRK